MLIIANDLFIVQATLTKEKKSKIEHKPLLKLPTKIQNRNITSISTYNFLSKCFFQGHGYKALQSMNSILRQFFPPLCLSKFHPPFQAPVHEALFFLLYEVLIWLKFVKHSLCGRHISLHTQYALTHSILTLTLGIIFPKLQMRKQRHREILSNFAQVTQPVSGRPRLSTQAI